MKLLLDTHILLWSVTASEKMPTNGAELVQDGRSQLLCSAASIWEVAIKHAKGQGIHDPMPMSGMELLEQLKPLDIEIMAMSAEHGALAGQLPPHHADPFDRMLVAQTMQENLQLLTSDGKLSAYGDFVITV